MAIEWDEDRRSELAINRERERTRRPAKGKIGGESARNLLNSVLDDTAAAAEEERIRLEEARKRAEEEARLQKEREEEMARMEAEQAIMAEQQAQEDLKHHQEEMQAQLQRQKDIEAGIIDLEEEARQKRAEEERIRAEEAERVRKAEAKKEALALQEHQKIELEKLKLEERAREAAPKKSKLPMVLGIAALMAILAVAGLFVFGVFDRGHYGDAGLYYNLSEEINTRGVAFVQDNEDIMGVKTAMVKQAEDPKPVAAPKNRPKRPAAAAAPEPSKPSLMGGRGGLFGGGKL